MQTALSFFDTVSKRTNATQLQRCFRVIQVVASVWTLLGAGTLFFGLDSASIKPRIFGIGCLLVAAAIYSIYFPLYYILREPRAD